MANRNICGVDDRCFECNDGGDLLVCDHQDSGKGSESQESMGSESQESMGSDSESQESIEFIGWASNPVLSFLASTGKDALKPLTRWAVCYLIYEYVKEKRLHHQDLKNEFVPDEKLFPIFRRNVVPESEVYRLLKPHIADDENIDSFTYKPDQPSLLIKSLLKKGDYVTRMSCFASISAENIKLIYLKQSLVIELSKQPESFEAKVIGTFVKIQMHLVRVTGVNKELLLQVSFMPRPIAISELSDCDFTEHECETLQQRVKEKLLPKITIKELEAKATCLHEDITKHWFAKRRVYLEKRIEYANDKGRLREKDVLLDEKLELEQPGKMEKLLRESPTVFPEYIQQKYDPDDTWEPHEQAP